MKYLITLCMLYFCIPVNAQNAKYLSMMQENINRLDTSKTIEALQETGNAFERIAGIETSAWQPLYYLALCNVRMAYVSGKKMVDDYCDKAEGYINKADSISPNNSEIYVVKAMVNSARIMANPASRGAKYGPISDALLEKAKTLDANNPRVYLTQGMGLYYTPKMFGGGKAKALPLFSEAIVKFATFKPGDALAPNWGEALAKSMQAKCAE